MLATGLHTAFGGLAILILALTPFPAVAEQEADHPRVDMKYIVSSDKTVEAATAAVEEAAKNNQFGVLHVHDLQATMKKKGVDFPNACRILEICNPQKAKAVLTADMEMNMALPCRISVYEENGKTRIGMIRPTALLASLSDSEDLAEVAREVEETTIKIIEEAR